DICTRSCRFCATKTGKPLPPDENEPARLADAVKKLGLSHCVITSVDRDDLPDGGASFWAKTITEVKKENPGITIEALIPDFDGKEENIKKVIDTQPDILSHNLETVKRLTPLIRTKAKYDRSLSVIRFIAGSGIPAKSGLMLGLGETEEEILETMDDLLEAGCSILTLGQYLKPADGYMEPVAYISPEKFAEYRKIGLSKGFTFVESGPLVRSSWHAEKHIGAR
ncbi:MAG TPA: lipoyl synthase, partial [Bacteroidales bacterium]|nr:lipoyl synthase [Bacteroidales bacterium]